MGLTHSQFSRTCVRESVMLRTPFQEPVPGAWPKFAALALILLATAVLSYGQAITGRLVGTIQDPAGAAVVNAKIVIVNEATGIATTLSSNSVGDYVAPLLPPGKYRIEVEVAGFKKAVSSENIVNVDQATRVDFQLQIGSQDTTVDVKATAPLVRSTSSDVGETMEMRQIQSVPLNGRIFSQMVQLVPGALPAGWGDAPESASGAGAKTAISASVNGLPWSGTTYTIDGVSNMEPLNAFINIAPPIEAIEEFKVQSNNPSAEIGGFGGATVNINLRSGTNQFHGSLFEYLRNQSLNAREYFSAEKDPYKSNQFGGTIGGPIVRNKLFFFFDYQGLRLRNGQNFVMTVPTTLMRQGIFSPDEGFSTIYDPATRRVNPAYNPADPTSKQYLIDPFPASSACAGCQQIPNSQWDPISAQILQFWPTPNRPGYQDNYWADGVETQGLNQFDAKADYDLGSNGRLFARESYTKRNLTDPVIFSRFLYTGGMNSTSRNHNADIGYVRSFSPTLLNELRVGFSRFNNWHFGNDYPTMENNALGIHNGNIAGHPETYGIAGFWVGSLNGTGSDGWSGLRLTNAYQIVENLTWIKGSHTVKFGGDLQRIESTLTNMDYNPRGDFGFDNLITSDMGEGGAEYASFLAGYPAWVDRGILNSVPGVRINHVSLYAQDDFRVTKKLTFNIGLRWDFYGRPYERNNQQGNFDLQDGKIHIASNSDRGPLVDSYYKNFGPRFGFAYSPDNGKTAVRGAYGIGYFNMNYGAIGGTLERSYPMMESFYQQANDPYLPFATVSDGLAAPVPQPIMPGAIITPPDGLVVTNMPKNFRPAESVMWNFGVQRQLSETSALDVSYIGTRGLHLYRTLMVNTPLAPGTGPIDPRRPFYSLVPGIQYIYSRESTGDSYYNGLQAKFTKRFSNGLQALVSYTWSRAIDDLSIFWPWDNRMNRASSARDIRHNLVASYSYELPVGNGKRWMSNAPKIANAVLGGWTVNGITMMRTGAPLTIWAQSSQLGTGTSNRADLTCSNVRTIGTIQNWFDTSCFANPAPLEFGNSSPGVVRGPGLVNFDLSAAKSFSMGEKRSLEFRAELFNAFNTPHFGNPGTTVGRSSFGRISSTTMTPRQVQLGLKFLF